MEILQIINQVGHSSSYPGVYKFILFSLKNSVSSGCLFLLRQRKNKKVFQGGPSKGIHPRNIKVRNYLTNILIVFTLPLASI